MNARDDFLPQIAAFGIAHSIFVARFQQNVIVRHIYAFAWDSRFKTGDFQGFAAAGLDAIGGLPGDERRGGTWQSSFSLQGWCASQKPVEPAS